MTYKSFFVLAIFLLSSLGTFCQVLKMKSSPITGTWIELNQRADTIIFSAVYDSQNPVFELKRGKRISDGYELPGYFSGPYNYKLENEHISLYWFLSSGTFKTYYFKMIPEENLFKIGNFFKDPEKKMIESDTLTFIRIK